jgi:hypothetical protein
MAQELCHRQKNAVLSVHKQAQPRGTVQKIGNPDPMNWQKLADFKNRPPIPLILLDHAQREACKLMTPSQRMWKKAF